METVLQKQNQKNQNESMKSSFYFNKSKSDLNQKQTNFAAINQQKKIHTTELAKVDENSQKIEKRNLLKIFVKNFINHSLIDKRSEKKRLEKLIHLQFEKNEEMSIIDFEKFENN